MTVLRAKVPCGSPGLHVVVQKLVVFEVLADAAHEIFVELWILEFQELALLFVAGILDVFRIFLYVGVEPLVDMMVHLVDHLALRLARFLGRHFGLLLSLVDHIRRIAQYFVHYPFLRRSLAVNYPVYRVKRTFSEHAWLVQELRCDASAGFLCCWLCLPFLHLSETKIWSLSAKCNV